MPPDRRDTLLVVAAAAVGVALRVTELVRALGDPLTPDGVGYLALARRFSWLHPWRASLREPGWVAVTKVVTAPFGYDADAVRVFTLVVGVVALALAARLARRFVPGPGAAVGVAIVAVHPLLVADAASGLRESLVALLLVVAVTGMVERRWWMSTVAAVVAVTVRWEAGLLALAVLAVGAGVRKVPAPAALLAIAAAAAVMGPFLVANARAFDDPLRHSDVHAAYYRRVELGEDVGRGIGVEPDDAAMFRESLTWWTYYTDFVGPRETLRRSVRGAVRLPVRLAGMTVAGPFAYRDGRVPRSTAGDVAGVGALAWCAVGAVLGARRRVVWSAALVFAGLTVSYVALTAFLDPRLVSVAVFPLALAIAAASPGFVAPRR